MATDANLTHFHRTDATGETHEFPFVFSPVDPPKHDAALDTSVFVYPSSAQVVENFQVDPLCQGGGLDTQFQHDGSPQSGSVMQPPPWGMGVEVLSMDSPFWMGMEGQLMDSPSGMGVRGKGFLSLFSLISAFRMKLNQKWRCWHLVLMVKAVKKVELHVQPGWAFPYCDVLHFDVQLE